MYKRLTLLWLAAATVLNLSAQPTQALNTLDPFIGYGPLVMPYATIQESLSFDANVSTKVIQLSWRQEKALAAGNGPAKVQVFVSKVELPAGWQEEEKFLYIFAPKMAFELEVNDVKTQIAYAGVNTFIHLTPLLQDNTVTITITTKERAGAISEVAHKLLLVARPEANVESFYVSADTRHRKHYRGLTWGTSFEQRNFTAREIDSKYERHEYYSSRHSTKYSCSFPAIVLMLMYFSLA